MLKPTAARLALLLISHALVGGRLPAQDEAAQSLPPRLSLGSLHQGNLVQASLHLKWPEGVTGDFEIEAPPFVRVLKRQPPELVVAIKTDTLGALDGKITVRRGGHAVVVPVEAVVLPRLPGQTRVLLASAPWDAQSTDDDSVFDTWRRVVATGKLQPHYVVTDTYTRWIDTDVLQQVDVVLLSESCLVHLTNDDAIVLQGFVCGGGRLIVCASGFYVGTVEQANDLTEPFGLRMHDEEVRGAAQFDTEDGDIAAHALTAGVERIRLQRPCPTSVLDERGQSLVKTDAWPGRPVIALARTASGGEVITLGVPLWWTWISMAKDNERLLRNLLTRQPPAPR